jgi:hypothetical protein
MTEEINTVRVSELSHLQMHYVIVLFYITQYSVRLFYFTFTQCYVYIFILFHISYVIYISYPIGWRDVETSIFIIGIILYNFPSEWFSSAENKRSFPLSLNSDYNSHLE